ncbi:bifunctional phosphopantothenoylcysteine decarboxylase/phosphopantothenate--cysteine ligase CoaBC [Accumulibacter sp.]|uniref:bifunctional phosphopantothenoylcysteine decarboxylase/phosphopantothenate--cysteine ligase CoaBC n=1 Tax=Accumulibacter sp. TaxID=2053492 RepID=UPI0025FB1D8E|nr:bifunctional phosphopantothenoylcysteine decarboxylase/phosphopantothenate--cysteine ligase CoaBC [Accumulibacter sp.]MCM8595088.1 bifunctional phosphopantothenoylcysteine decarboxylase/phosphopantothenate--cysteine ligase CoaBC [Accumulibacter sp.]MCM8625471.1 bifunctional phosphopantothenoylcysteine decarboxylase/phosphopantothenate--cysteine ligase CoaBC [Accumulibacter sp.]MDS4049234.1 bifunctional phosphopantothenoylcysteine decarboxylase/phosphopantothenate--cysteine ligase CoaBC [Accum
MELAGKRIVLGVTGGIAAYKAAELVRLLRAEGASVQVVMSDAATHFVTPVTFQALSGKPVFSDQWDPRVASNMAHIDLSREAHTLLVAPASADFLAKLAHGLADDLLSTLALARDCPLLVAPAMNRQMWENPATRRNVATLRGDGVVILGPASGDQACGESGPGRMLEPAEIVAELVAHFQPKRLAGRRVLLTAGPTFEAIDPVRGITNLSSGRMGYAIARAAREAGAEVTLVSGPVSLACPPGVTRVPVTSALEMHAAVHRHVRDADVFVAVAAVADYRPARPLTEKIKKGGQAQAPTIDLVLNPDILAEVAALPDPPLCVGFAAESERLAEYAESKRRSKKIPLIAGNLIQDGFAGDSNRLILFDDEGQHPLPPASKLQLARQLVERIGQLLERRR